MNFPARGSLSYSGHSRSWGFSPFERWLAIGAVVALLVGSLGLYSTYRKLPRHEVPVVGGTYVEGVVNDSPTKVDQVIASLTNSGLTYRDTDGTIKPDLASSWDISSDNKSYTFHLREGLSSQTFLSIIKANKTDWTGMEILAPTPQTLQFNLPEPLSPFLATTTKALFPFGPYEIATRDKSQVTLRSRPNFVLGEPYLSQFQIKIYDMQDQLVKAIQNDDVTGSADFPAGGVSGFKDYSIDLPHYYVLFFNTTKTNLKKVSDRQRIINKTDGPPETLTLATNQSDVMSNLATKLAADLKPSHINLKIDKQSSVTLQKDTIPKRQFDLLLYGVNYGVDPYYYPFWHSSQATATGLNISDVRDKNLDTLLDNARHELDPTKRADITKSIQDYLTSNALQEVLGQEKFNYWVSPSIKGVQYGKIEEGSERFGLVWRWYSKSKLERVTSKK